LSNILLFELEKVQKSLLRKVAGNVGHYQTIRGQYWTLQTENGKHCGSLNNK